MKTIQLWDLPVRIFHWLLVLAVAGAIITIKLGGTWMVWHERFGLLVLGLVIFRVIWGFIGSSTARFLYFVRGPVTIFAYLRGRWQGVGHNPLGALSVLALLGLFGFQAVSGLFATDEIAFYGPLYAQLSSEWSSTLSGWHRQTEWYLYGLVALHLAAVLFYTLLKRNNLITPMVTGKKQVEMETAQDTQGGGVVALVAALLLTGLLLLGASGQLIPPPPAPAPAPQDLGW